jgi:hypothetical protein
MEYRDRKSASRTIAATISRFRRIVDANNTVKDDKFLLQWLTVFLEDYDEVVFLSGIVEDTPDHDNGSVGACSARCERTFGNVWRVFCQERDVFNILLDFLEEYEPHCADQGQNSVTSDQTTILRSLVELRTAAVRSVRDTVLILQSTASM